MIVKVPKNRHDGSSSFGDLKKYITEGIGQAGQAVDTASWDRLTQYITQQSILDALGAHVEKTIGVEIGNVECLNTAAAEMRAVASENQRAKNPVYHYILSWPETERPPVDEIFGAARDTLKALGMHDHQYIIAIHANTDNIHAHIEVNRVHPITFKAARLAWAHKTLHQAAREIEIARGWRHDNGLFQVVVINGSKHIVPNTGDVNHCQQPPRGAANDFETWTGEQSFETWCKGVPASALKALLADKGTTSWQHLHRVLNRYGLQLRDSGGGGMRIHDMGEAVETKTGRVLAVSASKAFRFMKRKDLEVRFGPFAERTSALDAIEHAHSYRRDPEKRIDTRLERKALRDALHNRFQKEQKEARLKYDFAKRAIAEEFAGDDDNRRAALDRQYKERRAAIKVDAALSAPQKQQAYMLLKLTMLRARDQLKQQIACERQERKTLLPTLPVWREWVEQQAMLGDDAARSAIRGMVYQDRRNEKKTFAASEALAENAIRPAISVGTDPLILKVSHLVWHIGRNGNVTYRFKNGEPGFIDAGEKLVFARAAVSDEALVLTLRYARDKWDGELRITGGDAIFHARVAHIADKLGIELKNPNLNTVQRTAKLAETPSPEKRASSQLGPTAIPIKESIETVLQRQYPNAQIQHAAIQAKRYTGPLVAHDERFVAQHLGIDQYVLHEKKAFSDGLPDLHKSIAIDYRAGSLTVQRRQGHTR